MPRSTPLNAAHRKLGGRMVDFAGWDMPVQYAGVIQEHELVRTHVGLFDVSHMGEIEFKGPGALEEANRLITNDLEAPAEHIGALYKARWQVELFFRWIKQHLKIKRFLGTSENAVRTQIAVALIVFLILRLAADATRSKASLLTFARLVRANLMHLRPLDRLHEPPPDPAHDPRQQELALC